MSTIKQLFLMALQACLFSLLTPALWWLLPCPSNALANGVVFLSAVAAAASWLALLLAIIVFHLESMLE
jgi:hypothetical protein